MVFVKFHHGRSTMTFTFILSLWAQMIVVSSLMDSPEHVELLELGVLRCTLPDFAGKQIKVSCRFNV